MTKRSRRTNALPPFLFERNPFEMQQDELVDPSPAYRLQTLPHPAFTGRKLERFRFFRSQFPSIDLKVEGAAIIKIARGAGDEHEISFCVKATAPREKQVEAMLDQSSFTADARTLSIKTSLPEGGATCVSYLEMLIPAGIPGPITVTGDHAATEVCDVDIPVKLRCRFARATILETTGQVYARAAFIVFASTQGQVDLRAEEIALKIGACEFRGKLQADADRSLGILLPRSFSYPFQIAVNRPKDFVCNADLCPQIMRSRSGGLTVFDYRRMEPPVLRFVSRRGTVFLGDVA